VELVSSMLLHALILGFVAFFSVVSWCGLPVVVRLSLGFHPRLTENPISIKREMKNIYCNHLQSETEKAVEDSSPNLVSTGILSQLMARSVGSDSTVALRAVTGSCSFFLCSVMRWSTCSGSTFFWSSSEAERKSDINKT